MSTNPLPKQRIIGPSQAIRRVFYQDGDTGDIMRVVMYADKQSGEFIRPAAVRELQGMDEYGTCRNIFSFIKSNVRYKADRPGDEIVRSPGYLLQSKQGDCKSYSVALMALCRANGIKARYRFVAYAPGPYKHVYVVATLSDGRDVILDAVYGPFDREAPYKRKRDIRPGESVGVAGIGSIFGDSTMILFVALIAWLLLAKPFRIEIKKNKKRKKDKPAKP